MKRLLACTAASIALLQPNLAASSGAEPEQAAASPDEKSEAQDKEAIAMAEALRLADIWLETERLYSDIPAMSVAVVKGQDTVWAKGFGHVDRARKKPASADTIYSICSISKLFTAVAFMREWENGRVRLDEPVTTYLPWAVLAPDERESVPVTMRGLLTHSAGLPREAVNPYWTGPDFPFPTQAEIRTGIGKQEVLYPASTTFQYSNLGLTLVGETVEAVSGEPYADYISAHILDPLAMKDTRPYVQADKYGGQMAVGWGSLEADGSRPAVKLFDARGINPAAGFTSTVNDLAAFAKWQFRLLKSGEPEILRASTLREMQRVHYITPDRETSWGLGFVAFQMNGKNFVGHSGSCPGYRSTLSIDPGSEMAIAIAINAMENPGGLARNLGALIGKRMDAKNYDALDGEAIDLADYSGTYSGQPWARDFVIVPWAGGLAFSEPAYGNPAEDLGRLKPIGKDRFRVMTDKGEERDVLTFYRDASGKVTRFERFGNFNDRIKPLD